MIREVLTFNRDVLLESLFHKYDKAICFLST